MKTKIDVPVIARVEAIVDIINETKLKESGPLGVYITFVDHAVKNHLSFLLQYAKSKALREAFFLSLTDSIHSWAHALKHEFIKELQPLVLTNVKEQFNLMDYLVGDIRKRYDPLVYEEYLCSQLKNVNCYSLNHVVESGPKKGHEEYYKRVKNFIDYKHGNRSQFL